jgi:hypothetical protein
LFDVEMTRAFCVAKALETPGLKYPHDQEKLVSQYLFHWALTNGPSSHPFSETIYSTVEYIIKESPLDEPLKLEYLQKLCVATAQGPNTIMVKRIFKSELNMIPYLPKVSIEENTLVAAIYLEIPSLYRKLVENGIPLANTWFGSSL